MDNSNFRSFPSRHKSSRTILPINRLQDACSRKARQIYPGAWSTFFLPEYENILLRFREKMLSELEKNGNSIFQSRPRVEVKLTPENGKSTSNTGLKDEV